jgi:short-subunit dehydrogenase
MMLNVCSEGSVILDFSLSAYFASPEAYAQFYAALLQAVETIQQSLNVSVQLVSSGCISGCLGL